MGLADYEITFAGELPSDYDAAFSPHAISHHHGTSTVRAERIDEAALIALLARGGDLALALIRVERVSTQDGGGHG